MNFPRAGKGVQCPPWGLSNAKMPRGNPTVCTKWNILSKSSAEGLTTGGEGFYLEAESQARAGFYGNGRVVNFCSGGHDFKLHHRLKSTHSPSMTLKSELLTWSPPL